MAGYYPVIFCDIGNTRMHICIDAAVMHLDYDEGFRRFGNETVYYICVNDAIKPRIETQAPRWIDLSKRSLLQTDYRGLGIDREALCLGVEHGVVIDAGSAITVDVMERGRHLGGWIWPGLRALKEAYARISSRLDRPVSVKEMPAKLPEDTDAAIAFGIFRAIQLTVEAYRDMRPLYLTGGDAAELKPLFPEGVVDERLIFKGMEKMLNQSKKDRPC